MQLFKHKRLILIVLTLVCVLGFSVFSFVSIKSNKDEKSAKSDLDISAAYDLGGSEIKHDSDDGTYTIPSSIYDANTSFKISNLTGLKAFAGIVNSNDEDFSGKTVYLDANIDCESSYVTIGFCWIGSWEESTGTYSNRIFRGDFDGKNHTISNFKSNKYYYTEYRNTKEENWYCYGFFAAATGTIKNLRLKNFTIEIKNHALGGVLIVPNYVACGGIVGSIGSDITITNCAVEGFKIVNPRGSKQTHIAGIIGFIANRTSNIVVKNCYVQSESKSINAFIYGDYWLQESGITAKACVFNMPLKKDKDTDAIITHKNNTNGINSDCDNKPSEEVGPNRTWYYTPGYNDGYPYLKQFIKWQTLTFASQDKKKGSVDTASITIPKTNLEEGVITNRGSATSMDILHYTINANPVDSYKVARWAWNSNKTICTVYFTQKTFTLTFKDSSKHVGMSYFSDVELDKAYVLPVGTIITYTFVDLSTITMAGNGGYEEYKCFSQMYVEFYDEKGMLHFAIYIMESEPGEKSSDKNKYTMRIQANDSFIKEGQVIVKYESNHVIDPVAVIKEYNVTIG